MRRPGHCPYTRLGAPWHRGCVSHTSTLPAPSTGPTPRARRKHEAQVGGSKPELEPRSPQQQHLCSLERAGQAGEETQEDAGGGGGGWQAGRQGGVTHLEEVRKAWAWVFFMAGG